MSGLGIYVHVPFCASTCDFCAFYQEAPRREDLDAYLDTLEKEVAAAECRERVDTVFFGGGTPGLLPARDFERLFAALHRHLDFQPREVTVELAPSTVKADKARVLRELGVTRVSMGVQSFDPATLEALGRRQSVKQVYEAYGVLRDAGFDNINLDLMFAYPGQGAEAWERDLREAVRLGPEHLSTYCLTFEEDTALWVKLRQGKLRRDIGAESDLYELTWRLLPELGYAQYEVSNFARPGHACLHNLATWHMGEWRGFGPGAASQYGGWRFANPADLAAWSEGVHTGGALAGPPAHAVDVVKLSPELLLEDALIFGLRMNDGVVTDELLGRWPAARAGWQRLCPILDELTAEGYLEQEAGRLRLTDEGRLRADAVGSMLLEAEVDQGVS